MFEHFDADDDEEEEEYNVYISEEAEENNGVVRMKICMQMIDSVLWMLNVSLRAIIGSSSVCSHVINESKWGLKIWNYLGITQGLSPD